MLVHPQSPPDLAPIIAFERAASAAQHETIGKFMDLLLLHKALTDNQTRFLVESSIISDQSRCAFLGLVASLLHDVARVIAFLIVDREPTY